MDGKQVAEINRALEQAGHDVDFAVFLAIRQCFGELISESRREYRDGGFVWVRLRYIMPYSMQLDGEGDKGNTRAGVVELSHVGNITLKRTETGFVFLDDESTSREIVLANIKKIKERVF